MSDMFHDDVPDEFIADVFAVMALAPRHTFQLLTKRHARMRSLLSDPVFTYMVQYITGAKFALVRDRDDKLTVRRGLDSSHVGDCPLPNVWLGVSVENQQWADIRIPALLDTPAAVRFLSCEPLLGPVSLHRYTAGWPTMAAPPDAPRVGIDWAIVGGESGPGARPMHPDWARSLRDQCTNAGVPFLFKQWGEWRPYQAGDGPERGVLWEEGVGSSLVSIVRAGKKGAGRELDGRTWDEYPAATS